MKKVTIYIAVTLLPLACNAQSGIVPLPLLKLRDNYTFDNPAAAVLTESADFKIIHSSFTGLAGNVGLNYLEGNLTGKNKSGNSAHVAGLMIHSEFETDILKRTRLYFRYSWNTKISENTKLSAGIHAGFFNYAIRSSNSSSGVSVFAPDANIGLWLNGKKTNLGISSSQILNSKVRPVNSQYSLNRYLNLFADYKLLSFPNTELTAGAKLYYGGKTYQGFTSSLILQLKDILSTEVNYSLNKGITYSAGIIKLPLFTFKGDLFFSYFHSTGIKNLLNNNRFELNLRIYLIKAPTTDIKE
jgi:hypothetical protein